MGKETGISWTGATWNPWQGCHKVSLGCKNCYMFAEKRRYGQEPNVVVRSSPQTFNGPLKWKEPALVFTCSWSDWFIEEADPWRAEAWSIIRRTPHLTYQILTKRPERVLPHLPADWGQGYPNVWLGVSVEDQQRADLRIPLLLQAPAAVRFLSCEPLLGPVDLSAWFWPYGRTGDVHVHDSLTDLPGEGLHWVIVGGESGGGARECDVAWVRALVGQCRAAAVACFVKQLGAWPVDRLDPSDPGRTNFDLDLRDRKGGDVNEFPADLRVRQFPERSNP